MTQENRKIEFKSLLIGLLIGTNLLFFLGAADEDQPAARGFSIPQENLCETGRFSLSATDNETVYILDTKTGHVWYRTDRVIQDLGTPAEPEMTETRVEKQVF
ncbi:hypothetical protein SMSP2_00485 [Limihaloglobus sulfuriphilus]|uniref:Uncharacterized protein n=1 Tax=Limihaloglobus sulfuriphilus TaxID=1851148 RepID=A0A1Q2MBQ0_9BACT|nr:hypothetical protein [Limihaloglobus sulfuriphilus]AQQ70143.1 hypothetical protein SMSP2_00485 [Limihaloglobus sulfuriphilus]